LNVKLERIKRWTAIKSLGYAAVGVALGGDISLSRTLSSAPREFERDNPKKFTRSWFAWANTLFGELVLKVHSERPQLLRQVV
jgi:Metal-independent alpha-mannosidase (GH125)